MIEIRYKSRETNANLHDQVHTVKQSPWLPKRPAKEEKPCTLKGSNINIDCDQSPVKASSLGVVCYLGSFAV
jgi:hypothetical protein